LRLSVPEIRLRGILQSIIRSTMLRFCFGREQTLQRKKHSPLLRYFLMYRRVVECLLSVTVNQILAAKGRVGDDGK